MTSSSTTDEAMSHGCDEAMSHGCGEQRNTTVPLASTLWPFMHVEIV